MFRTLKMKFIALISILLFLNAGTYFFITSKAQKSQLITHKEEKAQLLTETIWEGLIVLMLEGEGENVEEFLSSIGFRHSIKNVSIFVDSGKIVYSSQKSQVNRKIADVDFIQYKMNNFSSPYYKNQSGTRILSMVKPFYNMEQCQECHESKEKIRGVLLVDLDLAEVEGQIKTVQSSLAKSILAAILSIAIGIWILFSSIVDRPIHSLIDSMDKVKKGNLEAKAQIKSSSEFERLSESFNSMVEDLDQSRKELVGYHEEEARRTRKLAILGELISGIAHEIKTSLGGISAAIQVLSSEFSEDDPRKEITTEIVKYIDKMNKDINDVLSFARPTPPRLEECDINHLVHRVIGFVKDQAAKGGVKLSTDMEDLLSVIRIDPEQIFQVFLNLSINALQAMPEGGSLKISTRLENHDTSQFILIEFKDTGKGIPDEYTGKIFTPFFSTKKDGTGLGLSISQAIVEGHGGWISFESKMGKGSVFSIKLPLNKLKAES